MVRFWMLLLGLVTGFSDRALAQVIPDQTLPAGERSQVSGNPNSQINGGAIRGSNLFHSFQQFSIPTGGSAAFNNAPTITNIITRVTGSNVSNIDGLIRANGTANLFLINPNGILFGANARLELGGSFVASTADRFVFNNGFGYSASDPQTPPLLTISAPIGLRYGDQIADVRSQGASLEVANGQTLALIGGNVGIEGGQLFAPGGRVELAGIAAGEVGLRQQEQEWRLSVPDGLTRADVSIADSALIDVTSSGGGNIAINARNVNILGSSDLTAGIAATSNSAVAQAGEITFNATGTVRIAEGSNVFNLVEPGGVGNAGGIRIVARSAELDDGSQLGSYTYGRGNTGDTRLAITDTLSLAGFGGNDGYTFIGNLIWPEGVGNTGDVIVSARSITLDDGAEIGTFIYGIGNVGDVRLSVNGTLSLAGRKLNGFVSGIASQVLRGARGRGGNITISANSIALNDGAGLVTTTFGNGDAGNITLEVNDTLSLSGLNNLNQLGSNIQSTIGRRARGNGGNITIRAGSIILMDGAFLNNSTSGEGNAGNITMRTNGNLSLTGISIRGDASGIGSSVDAGARGNGGNITITARSVTMNDGAYIVNFSSGQGDAGDVSVRVADTLSFAGFDGNGFSSGIESNIERNGAGNGGDIDVVANALSLSDEARFTSSNLGQGVAGNIRVQARSVILRQGARFTTETASGQGGDINLQNVNLLLLRDGSSISSTAGIDQAGGDGGNITINGNFIAAVPKENSNISANAFTGRGGNIRITTQGLFGIEPRASTTTGLSSITASSQFGISGTITLNRPDVDPSQGLVTLPTDLQDTSRLIASTCPADEGNSFAITGRGGLPEDPRQPLMGDSVWLDDRATGQIQSTTPDPIPQIVEAQGWIRDRTGQVTLVATHPGSVIQPSQSVLCSLLKRDR